MASEKKKQSIVHDIYMLLYREATPQADFDELVAFAEVDERGEKIIDFMAHEISQSKFNYIMESVLAKHKLTRREKAAICTTVYLGCSPKFKHE
jgi:cytidylate kinase